LVQTTMVRITKQRLDGINKRIREIVEGSKEFIECVKHGNALENAEDTAAVLKLKLERNLEKLKGMIKEIDDPEIEKVLEDYEESQFNGEDMLAELEVLIVKCKDKRQIELNERKQRMEMEQKEKERRMEIEYQEKEKRMELEAQATERQIQEKIQLAKVNLERLKIEVDAQREAERIAAEVKIKEIEYERTN